MPILRLSPDLVCRQAVELMTDYLEGSLSRRQRRRLEKHLRGCPHCRAYLDQLRITIAAIGSAGEPPTDPATREALVDMFRQYRGEDPAGH